MCWNGNVIIILWWQPSSMVHIALNFQKDIYLSTNFCDFYIFCSDIWTILIILHCFVFSFVFKTCSIWRCNEKSPIISWLPLVYIQVIYRKHVIGLCFILLSGLGQKTFAYIHTYLYTAFHTYKFLYLLYQSPTQTT